MSRLIHELHGGSRSSITVTSVGEISEEPTAERKEPAEVTIEEPRELREVSEAELAADPVGALALDLFPGSRLVWADRN